MAVTNDSQIIEFDEQVFRIPAADAFLALLLNDKAELSIHSRDQLATFTIQAPMRTFLIELLTRLRIGMDIKIVAASDDASVTKQKEVTL